MSADSDVIYTYRQIDDLTLDKLTEHLERHNGVVNVEARDKWGWHCEVCHEDSGAVYSRAMADMMLKRHCKKRTHRTNAASPTRLGR